MRLFGLAAFLAAIAGVIVSPAYGSCALTVEWKDVSYVSVSLTRELKIGPSLGIGAFPPCRDTAGAGCQEEYAEPATIFAVPDVLPEVAVAVAGEARTIFLAPGYFAYLPGEALHDVMFGPDRSRPDWRKGVRCVEPFSVFGTVSFTPAPGTVFRLSVSAATGSARDRAGRTMELSVDGHTKIVGLERHGIPYVQERDEVKAEGVLCHRGGGAIFYAVDTLSEA